MKKQITSLIVTASLVVVAACAAPPAESSDAPAASTETTETQVVDSYGWDQTVTAPVAGCHGAYGTATFKRVSGPHATRSGGYCTLRKGISAATCNVDADCRLPGGDYAYCLGALYAPNTKSCWYKSGTSSCLARQVMTLSTGQSRTFGDTTSGGSPGDTYITMSVLNLPGAGHCGNTAIVPGTSMAYAEHPSYCQRVVSTNSGATCDPGDSCDENSGCYTNAQGVCICQ